MKNAKLLAAVITMCFTTHLYAGVITVEDQNVNTHNCIPFSCAGSFDPFMTNIYKDIVAFNLKAGDTIAFDLAAENNVDIIFDIYLAAASSNGSTSADGNGFTKVVSAGNGGRGTAAQGDYELVYTIDTDWDFLGGGLLISFSPQGVTASDQSFNGGFYGNNSAANTHVGQFYSGSSVGTGTYRNSIIPNFQLTTSVPEPATLGFLGLGLLGFGLTRRRRAA